MVNLGECTCEAVSGGFPTRREAHVGASVACAVWEVRAGVAQENQRHASMTIGTRASQSCSLAPGWEAAADRLTSALPKIDHIVCSPLGRCRLLAGYLSQRLTKPVTINEDLTEMDFGAWENTLWDDVPRQELDAWADDFYHARPHGGESVAMLQTRVRRALKSRPEGAVLWVGHAGLYRSLLAETEHPDPWNAQISFGAFEILNI